jgi:hypothetical protein
MKLFDLFTAVTVIAVIVALMVAGSEDADAQTIEYDRWSTHAYIAATQDDDAKYVASVFFFPGRCDQGVMVTNFNKDAVTVTIGDVSEDYFVEQRGFILSDTVLKAMYKGSQMSVQGDVDTVTFSLSGADKALADAQYMCEQR